MTEAERKRRRAWRWRVALLWLTVGWWAVPILFVIVLVTDLLSGGGWTTDGKDIFARPDEALDVIGDWAVDKIERFFPCWRLRRLEPDIPVTRRLSVLWARYRGRVRMRHNQCPRCNSDAPEVNTCLICESYDRVRNCTPYPPSENRKLIWQARFELYLQDRLEKGDI